MQEILRTTNQTNGYWWNGADAFTVIMVYRKDGHNGAGSYGDAYFILFMNGNSGNSTQSWAMGPFGDHSWGGQYGEIWGGIQNDFEGLEVMFSYPWRGLFMVRMFPTYAFSEISVNSGSGWKKIRVETLRSLVVIGTTFREMSIFCNFTKISGHSFDGRIAECILEK